MDTRELIELIQAIAKTSGIDPNLAVAIAGKETGLNTLKVRVEPLWKYLVVPRVFSQKLGISYETECTLQSMSWNCMQVMGSVARELGFSDHLTRLIQPELGILFSCKKLAMLKKQYSNELDVISSYNQGSPVKNSGGAYRNNQYVVDVSEKLVQLRRP